MELALLGAAILGGYLLGLARAWRVGRQKQMEEVAAALTQRLAAVAEWQSPTHQAAAEKQMEAMASWATYETPSTATGSVTIHSPRYSHPTPPISAPLDSETFFPPQDGRPNSGSKPPASPGASPASDQAPVMESTPGSSSSPRSGTPTPGSLSLTGLTPEPMPVPPGPLTTTTSSTDKPRGISGNASPDSDQAAHNGI